MRRQSDSLVIVQCIVRDSVKTLCIGSLFKGRVRREGVVYTREYVANCLSKMPVSNLPFKAPVKLSRRFGLRSLAIA